MTRVAALYIDPRGPYPAIPGVDCWDEKRNAKAYLGPWPVIAHPPCGPWSKLRHEYQGAEHSCGPSAVRRVRLNGGVLEQPSDSKLWAYMGIPRPWTDRDQWGGYSIEVCQVNWGHVARKRTWLYLVRVPLSALEAPPLPEAEPTHWASGSRSSQRQRKPSDNVPPGIKICSPEQRRRTPPMFAEYLVRLARSVVPRDHR